MFSAETAFLRKLAIPGNRPILSPERAFMSSNILIVDDDPLIHALYRGHLERAGFSVVTAPDGEQAIDAASSAKPSLIIMDIMMKNVDGLTALRTLKKSAPTKSIPVIVITSSLGAHDAVRKESVQSGAAAFLSKPFSPAQLVAEVKKVLSQ
jgi:CheY-like chemotaxis protein